MWQVRLRSLRVQLGNWSGNCHRPPQAGAKVMLCDIEAEARSRATDNLKATNADVESVKADVSLKAELKAAADATVARFGKVHILINNAGVGGAPYGFWTDPGWEWTIGVNLMAVVWGIEIFGPLIQQHGKAAISYLQPRLRGLFLPALRHITSASMVS